MDDNVEIAVLSTPKDMIDVLGGPQLAAEKIGNGCKASQVSMWIYRETVPPTWRPRLKELLSDAGYGVPADFLAPEPSWRAAKKETKATDGVAEAAE